MTVPRHLNAPGINRSESIKRLVNKMDFSVLSFFPGSTPRPEELQASRLTVTCGGPKQVVSLFKNHHLQKQPPYLYPGTGDTALNIIQHTDENRLIDYFQIPVTDQLYLHRVSLLDIFQKTRSQHDSHRTPLSQQLNILSTHDKPTGLVNRHHHSIRLTHLFIIAQADDNEFSLLIMSIVFFNSLKKTIDMQFGPFLMFEAIQ